MIPLAILCAVLVAVIAWQRSRLRDAMERGRNIEAFSSEMRKELTRQISSRNILIAEACVLLHDERHKGREENQKAWQAARDEWSAKVKGAKA